jgi:conjugal transfer ATP-binding protein TraC
MEEYFDSLKQYGQEIKEDLSEVTASYRAKWMKEDSDGANPKPKPSLKLKQNLDNLNLLDFLSYRSYEAKNCIFDNEKTLGFVLRVGHFSGMSEAAKGAFRSLINNDLPVNATMQLLNYASPRIGNLLDYWHKNSNKNAIFQKISKARYDFFKNSSWKSALANSQALIIRDYELYFCFSMPKTNSDSANSDTCLKLKAMQDKFIQGLKAINSNAYVLNDRDLANFLQEILNPSNELYKRKNTESHKDFTELLRSDQIIEMQKNQVIFSNHSKDSNPTNFNSANQFSCSYSIFEVVGFPEYWDLENSIDYIGNFETGISLPCPFYISFGFTLSSREQSQRMADKHRMIKTQQNDSKLPMFFPKMLEENNDWRYVSEMIGSGERMGKLVMHIVLANTSKTQTELSEQLLQDHFARLGFNLSKIQHDTLNSLLQTLPFGIGENWQILEQLKIPAKALSGACINLMPVFADSQNYTSPLMLLVGRRGQLFFFDNFKTADNINGNFNMIVVGASGRGKSVWLQEYTTSLLRNGGQVVIIDDGRSFKNTCELLDGDFVDFGGGEFCLNPFSLYKGIDDTEATQEYKENFEEPFIDLIVSILCIIINLDKNNDSDTEIGLYRSILTNAVIEVMNKKGKNGGFSDIRNELLSNPKINCDATKVIVESIVYILNSYSDDERYARYFNGRATLDLKNKLTVFELSDLEHSTILQSSALLTVTFLVYAKIRGKNTPTSLIIDEFWRMGKHPILKDPIGGFSRRGRKYNLSLIVASQCMSDFEASNSEAGAIALSQADWRIILSVDGKDDHILRNELMMSSGEIAITHTLAGVKGAYSEFMIRHKNNSWAIGRLLLDPFSGQLYSTKAEDMAAIKTMRANGMNVTQAIETLIAEKIA